MAAMRALDVPDARASLLEWYKGTDGRTFKRVLSSTKFLGKSLPLNVIERFYNEYVRFLESADCYYVSAEMLSLARLAANSMPEFELREEDLPSPKGIMVFESPLYLYTPPENDPNRLEIKDDVPVVAVAWGISTVFSSLSDSPSRPVLFYLLSETPAEVTSVTPVSGVPFAPPLTYDNEAVMFIGQKVLLDKYGPESLVPDLKTVRCAWLLMQQQVASVQEIKPDRAATRRAVRRGRPPSPVRIVTLRHQASAGTSEGREYLHRWVVKGHWRKQWYASQDRHVPIWIQPHVKGPAGAPLLGGEKVYAWTR